MRLVAVVLSWNGRDDTLACLESLRGMETICVDNASSDDSADAVAAAFPDVELIRNDRNLGFAGGNNVGIRFALARGCDFVWLLNNDTVAEPRALSAMVDAAERDSSVGLVGSVLYDDRALTRIQAWGGGSLSWLGVARARSTPGAVDHLVGASMLVRREVFEDAGLLDETFFLCLEETEFCRRAASKGWRLAVASESAVYHKLGASISPERGGRSPRADVLHVRSTGIFLGRQPVGRMVAAVPLRLAGIVIRRLARRQAGAVPALIRAYAGGVRAGRRTRRRITPGDAASGGSHRG